MNQHETLICGDFAYVLLEDGTAQITRYTGRETDLFLPAELDGHAVTAIGDSAFKGCTGLTSVTIPSSVVSIGDSAFRGCAGLTSVAIPEGVAEIGVWAFSGCTRLAAVSVPASVAAIGWGAFAHCPSLSTFELSPENERFCSVEGILYSKGMDRLVTFWGNPTEVAIPESVTAIETRAFCKCDSLVCVHIPRSVTAIGEGAFSDCAHLASIAIPDSVTAIESWTFFKCARLASVSLPDGLTDIGAVAFAQCVSLVAFAIPHGVTAIKGSTFSGCTGLRRVEIPNGVTEIGREAFAGCFRLVTVDLPESVQWIDIEAFCNCDNLAFVSLPDSLGPFWIGGVAFAECPRLTCIVGRDSHAEKYCVKEGLDYVYRNERSALAPKYRVIDGVVFSRDGRVLHAFPVDRTGSYAIPDGVREIGEWAFKDCRGLTGVAIPDSVTRIADDAFEGIDPLALTLTVGMNGCARLWCTGRRWFNHALRRDRPLTGPAKMK